MTEKECLNLIEAHHIQVTPILERDEGKVVVIGWQAGFRTINEGSRQNIILWLPKKLPTTDYGKAEWRWLRKATIEQVYCGCGNDKYRWISLNWAE